MEGAKILVLLKDSKLRSKISEILAVAKYIVDFTDSGKRAMEIVRNGPVDLIICGTELYGIDGYGVLRMVNKFIDTAGIAVITLLENEDQGAVRRAMEMGTDGYLVADFDDAELLNQVEARLRKKRFQFELFLKQHFQQKSLAGSGNEMFWLDARLGRFKPRSFRKNQVIYYKDEPHGGLYYVLSGRIKTFISDTSGHLLVTNIYGTGQWFGIEDFAMGSRTFQDAKAIDDSKIIAVPSKEINELIKEHPEILSFFVRNLAKTVFERDEQALDLAHATVRKRVSKTIIRLADEVKNSSEKKRVILPRNDLANVIGIAPETLSRILGDFAKEGLIEKEGNDIILKKVDGLKAVDN
jgi:CRP-like cAMP-binding protein/CheY-like chemotaxis protein